MIGQATPMCPETSPPAVATAKHLAATTGKNNCRQPAKVVDAGHSGFVRYTKVSTATGRPR